MQPGSPVEIFSSTLGMYDASACRHKINGARFDRLGITEAVPVDYLALKKIGHGGKTNVWMRSNLNTGTRWKFCGAYVIKKDKRPNHTSFPRG